MASSRHKNAGFKTCARPRPEVSTDRWVYYKDGEYMLGPPGNSRPRYCEACDGQAKKHRYG
eukprot:2041703-Rhodomonas_salina.1